MQKILRALLVVLLLSSSALADITDFSGFELGTVNEIQSGSGTNVVYCPTRGGTSPDGITPRTGDCEGRIAPTTTGTGSFRLGRVGPEGQLNSTINVSDAYYRFSFLVHTAPSSASEELWSSFDTASTPIQKGALRIDSARKISIYNTSAALVATGSTVLTLDTWYTIEVHMCTGASCSYAVKIDNSTELSGTGNFGTGTNGSARYGKHTDRNGKSVSFYYDDIVNDNLTWVGNARAKMLLPDSDGDINQWDDGTPPSDNSQIINYSVGGGAAIGTSTYVRNRGISINEEVKFNYQQKAAVSISGAIKSVKAVFYAAKDTSGTTPLPYVILQSNGATSTSGTPTGTLADTFTRAWLLNNSPDTSGAWDPGEIDTLQAGVGNGATPKVKGYALPVMVLYDENGVFSTPTPAPTYIPPTPPVPPYVKVFPGSTGFPDGQKAGSGRHLGSPTTALYRINSLLNYSATPGCADSDAGTPCTLRECMEATVPRTCVFEVAGYIDMAIPAGRTKADINVDYPYLTVAGQTAPNPGIHLRNGRVQIRTHDVLLMHFSIRPGDAEEGSQYTERDAITITPNNSAVSNISIDHMSLTYGIDEEISTSVGTGESIDNISVTNSIMGNGLASGIRTRYFRACSAADCVTGGSLCTATRTSGQAVNCTDYKQNHGLGSLIYPTTRINFHNNVYSQHYERNFRTYGDTEIEFINNIVYGWGGTSCSSTWNCADADPNNACKIYMYGNYYKRRATSGATSPLCPILYYGTVPSSSRAFLSHNICATRTSDSGLEWDCSSWPTTLQVFSPPFTESGNITPKTPGTAYTELLSGTNVLNGGVGARPWNRYVGDTDILNEVSAGNGTLKDCVSNCSSTDRPVFGTVGASTGWPSLTPTTRTLTQLDEGGWNKDTIEDVGLGNRTKLENYIYAFSDDGDPSGYPPPTATPTPTATNTPGGAATDTPTPTATPTVTSTPTNTPVASATPTQICD